MLSNGLDEDDDNGGLNVVDDVILVVKMLFWTVDLVGSSPITVELPEIIDSVTKVSSSGLSPDVLEGDFTEMLSVILDLGVESFGDDGSEDDSLKGM